MIQSSRMHSFGVLTCSISGCIVQLQVSKDVLWPTSYESLEFSFCTTCHGSPEVSHGTHNTKVDNTKVGEVMLHYSGKQTFLSSSHLYILDIESAHLSLIVSFLQPALSSHMWLSNNQLPWQTEPILASTAKAPRKPAPPLNAVGELRAMPNMNEEYHSRSSQYQNKTS